MSYKEMIPEEEYAKIVARDEAWAKSACDYLKSFEKKDKFVKFMNIRPMVNIKRMLEESTAMVGEGKAAFHEKPSHSEPYHTYTYGDALARVNQDNRGVCGRGAGDHVARVLLVARRVGNDELASPGLEVAVGNVDRDSLLPLGPQSVGEEREVDVAVAAPRRGLDHVLELIIEDRLRVVQ